jgi:hypothetical protein
MVLATWTGVRRVWTRVRIDRRICDAPVRVSIARRSSESACLRLCCFSFRISFLLSGLFFAEHFPKLCISQGPIASGPSVGCPVPFSEFSNLFLLFSPLIFFPRFGVLSGKEPPNPSAVKKNAGSGALARFLSLSSSAIGNPLSASHARWSKPTPSLTG